MKIDSVKFTNLNNVYKTKKVGVEPMKNRNSDKVEISDLGKYLNKVNTNKDEIDMNKVNDIKSRIENGTYKVDSKDLAKKINDKMKGEF